MPPLCNRLLLVGSCLAALLASAADGLDTWQWRAPQLQGNNLTELAYGNSTYVAVGDYGTILTSANGADWQSRSTVTNHYFVGVAFGNGRFVAVGNKPAGPPLGEQSVVQVSTDGVNWTNASLGGTQALTAIAFGDGKFLASGYAQSNQFVNYHGPLYTSTNGADWTAHHDAVPVIVDNITWGGGRFVAATGGRFYSSTNGLNWQSAPAPVDRLFENVKYLNGRFVALGYEDDYPGTDGEQVPAFAFSTNGLDWVEGSLVPFATYGAAAVNAAGFVNGLYVAVGWTNDQPETMYGQAAVWISTNAEDWNLAPATGLTAEPMELWTENGRLLAVGISGLIASTTDGVHWTRHIGPALRKTRSVARGAGLFVGVGANGGVQTSLDGFAWTEQVVSPVFPWADVTYGSNRFVAVGDTGQTMTSTDGTNWSVQTTTSYSLAGVAYGGGVFVTVGYSNLPVSVPPFFRYQILTSPDGLNWSNQLTGLGSLLWGVTYGNGVFVAVGGTNILTSLDGTNWTVRVSSSNASFRSVAFGRGTFVAAGNKSSGSYGNERLFYSTNGINWMIGTVPTTPSSYRFTRVAFAHGLFIAVTDGWEVGGLGMIFTSFNGRNWQQRHSPTSQPFSGIAADDRSIVLVGREGVILQSGDLRPVLRYEPAGTGQYQLVLGGGVSNNLYQVEVSTNLANWTPHWTNRLNAAEVKVFQGAAAFPEQYYRAQWLSE
jgi:hypothetical protein